MAAKAAPTPSNPRRASTQAGRLPLPRLSSAQLAEKQPQGAETLFSHSSVKIVSFSAPGPQRQSSASSVLSNGGGGSPNQSSGTLPWKSRNERVISVGPLRLYRVPGSVAFLHSGTLLLSLLPRSQCWCVDGQSKFALRNQEMIYRIELPYENDGEKAKVEELKEVLKEVIQYEKTACPFKRGFHIELPEEPDSPMRRVLVAPAAKGQYWEHDDTWKAETESKQAKEVIPDNVEAQEGKADSSSISEIHGLTPKPSQEYILEAKPETGQDSRQSSKEGSIRALAGFVTKEASRISKIASPHTTETGEVQVQNAIADSLEANDDNKGSISSTTNVGGQRHMSIQIDRSPLESVSKIAQSLEEVQATSPGATTTPPTESPTQLSSTEGGVPESPNTPTITQLTSEPEAILEESIDENPLIPDQVLEEEVSKPEISSEQDLIQDSPTSLSTPSISTPELRPPFQDGTTEDTAASTLATTNLVVEQEKLLQEELNSESSSPPLDPTIALAERIDSEQKPIISEISGEAPTPTVTMNTPLVPSAAVQLEEVQTVNDNLRAPATPSTPLRRRGSSRALRRARSRHFTADDDLTSSLISRLFAVLLGPPSGLVAIMMQIARRLLAGGPFGSGAQAWRLGFRRAKTTKMPGRWVDSEDESVDDEFADLASGSSRTGRSSGKGRAENDDDWDSLDEDDYGVPLGNHQNRTLNLSAYNNNGVLRARNAQSSDTPDSLD